MSNLVKKLMFCSMLASTAFLAAGANAWSMKDDCEGVTKNLGLFSNSSYSTEQAASGTKSCKLGITQGSDGWGVFGGGYTFPSKLAQGSAIWTRISLFVPTGFQINTNTGMLKFLRVHTASSAGANEGYHDLLFSVPGNQFWDTGVGNWTAPYIYSYEGFPKLLGVGKTAVNEVAYGKWETYEIYVKLDSVSKAAGGSGEVRIWKNNVLLLDRTDAATLVSSSSVADYFYLFTYWNGNAPATQSLYVDDLVITSDTPANRDSSGNPFIGGTVVTTTSSAPAAPSIIGITPN